MAATLRLDKLGRIVLPKRVREKLNLGSGDELEIEASENRITLRPLRGSAALRKKRGVWVFHSGAPLSVRTVQDTLEEIRSERDRVNLG